MAQKPITKQAYEKALERYATNSAETKKIIDASEVRIKKEMDARHEKLGSMPEELKTDAATIQQYCTENRKNLFGENKCIDFKHGTLAFRSGNYSVVIGEGVDEDSIIAALKKRNMLTYVVNKESLDKKKIITDRDNKDLVKLLDKVGVSVEQGESFKITLN